jgi:hypothetical protein
MNRVLLVAGILIPFLGCGSKTAEEEFWSWFAYNEAMLFSFESDRNAVFIRLGAQMRKVNEDLTFEFGPIDESGKREFIISAGGIKQAFPSVESLYASAPELQRWEFIKFRPRRTPLMDIELAGRSVKHDEVRFVLFPEDDQAGVLLLFDDYTESEKDFFAAVGFLFLDQVLGEYDVETKVGPIQFEGSNSEYYDQSFPLGALADSFDAYFQK